MSKEGLNSENIGDGVHQFYKEKVVLCEWGKILEDKSRWERYNLEKIGDEWKKIVEDEEWQGILGHDANNLDHMRMCFSLTRIFVDSQNETYPENGFSERERLVLRVTAAVHDLAEAKTGDNSFDLKTEEDEKEEMDIMSPILDEVLKDSDFGIEKEEIIEVLRNKESKLGRAFNIIESIGYFRTGIIAWRKSNKIDNRKVTEHLKFLASNVLGNQIKKLSGLVEECALAEYFINFYRDDISEAFEKIPMDIFDNYKDEEDGEKAAEDNEKKFKEAKEIWKEFTSK